ncbi:hypothetical protein M8A51_15295 [Schlegelella sp. S2-27]|uniref:Uncharacterized protein n=1 Tax=Caldimonas mangrovi TaxID=2944811 RepID=A0ABT0YQ75_9BURK|nr:hypothetical protein [Caldimonas mangrovi]MCM5680890.1 hypothetical protein [Caldimonas mangrovi]
MNSQPPILALFVAVAGLGMSLRIPIERQIDTQASSKEASLAGLCGALIGMSLVPGLVWGAVYATSGHVHEGVGAAYFLPLSLLLFPIAIVAVKCFERAGAFGTKRFTWLLVTLGVSAALLIAPYLAMRAVN